MSQVPAQVPTVTIDGVDYEVEKLSPAVRSLLSFYQTWSGELAAARLEVAKLEAALRQLSTEIIATVRGEGAGAEGDAAQG